MRTTEAGYVYHRADIAGPLTLFRSLDDMLYLVLPPQSLPAWVANNTSARMSRA